MIKKNYIVILLISLIITLIYFFSSAKNMNEDAIILIDSNLGDYRMVPDDKGGLTIYDLKILDE
jgi:putative cell wall-binding protein